MRMRSDFQVQVTHVCGICNLLPKYNSMYRERGSRIYYLRHCRYAFNFIRLATPTHHGYQAGMY